MALLILLLAGAAAVSSGSGAAALGAGGSSDAKLHVDSSCLTPQVQPNTLSENSEHKHGAATGTRMPIVHQHGPCSPLTDKHEKPPSDEEILAADQRRVDYMHRRVFETTRQVRPKRAAPSAPSSPAPARVAGVVCRVGEHYYR
ncbi:protein ASPARTIC PROTEASE IN GUARD CELL 2-like [Panicum miliaceum]|uniref:Protein ASPARTIC PROTEASE IN GUARD CELL 2-like n=1 Tax=Panicum miliaceum TaxID=4540 RepID=A0A3L6S7G5_PANMI|nr:protein ASPARTIC PROTEASE IN GUARD CELL 2-like [Panicum miliaceum]